MANANGEDDTITLEAGTYSLSLAGSSEDMNATGDLDLTEAGWSITFVGAGANATFIDQDAMDRVFQVFAGVTVVFRDLTITGGDVSTSGGGIMNSGGDVTLNNTTVIENIARGNAPTDGGGGIYNNGGVVTLVNRSGVRNNRANGTSGSGGGVFTLGGIFSATGSRIAGNRANRAGGGIEAAPGMAARRGGGFAVTLTNTDLNNNIAGPSGSAAPGNGGGLHITGNVDAQIVGGTVRNNFAAREGGGLWNGTGLLDLDDVTIETNAAPGPAADDGGGGVFNNGGLVDIDGGTITGNTALGAAGSGGGIHNRGFLEVTGTVISGNSASRAGGGIEDTGAALASRGGPITRTAILNNITLDDNDGGMAPGNGGGLHSGGGNVAMGGSIVTNNVAVEGGGLWGSGVLDVENTTITGNIATGDPATKGGGGVFNSGGALQITGGTIAGNTATGTAGSGGGVFHLGGTTSINGTEISGNTAVRAGGGLETAIGGTISVTDVDFVSNTTGASPGNGGAIHVTAGDVTVTGGSASFNIAASEGGGFWNNAGWTMTVDGTSFSTNDAQGDAADNGGGGLFNNGGTLIVRNATVEDNTASGISGSGGGLFNFGGRMEIFDTMVSGNTSNRAGGGIEDTGAAMSRGDLETGTFIANTVVSGNDAGTNPGNGGGVHSGSGFVNFSSGEVSGNTAVEGGGLWTSGEMEVGDGGFVIVFPDLTARTSSGDVSKGLDLPEGAVAVTNNIATGDPANKGGGGLFNQGGTMTLASVLVANNQATGTAGSGGGLFNNNGTLTVNTSAFIGNSANRAGGGIEDRVDAPATTKVGGPAVTIDGSLFLQNDAGTAPGNGGGLHITGAGSVAVSASAFAENVAVEGGGLWNSGAGSLTVFSTTVIANTATRGGGLFQDGMGGSTFVEQSLVAGNTAINGGGLDTEGGDVTVINSTLSSNMAVRGGGVRQQAGTVSLGSTTIAQNDASNRGGGLLIVSGATMNVQNTIIGENTSPQGRSCSGTLVSQDHNLIESRAGCNITGDTANTLSNTLAMLAPLADNGGPTRTHALETGSPAIDAGQTVEAVDQRGFARDTSPDDMGAFELGGTPPMMLTEAGTEAPAKAVQTAPVPETSSLVTMEEPVRLGAIAPNPLRAGTRGTVSFAVREAEAVTVSLFDATGRQVATLYSGTPEAGQPQTAALDAGTLAAGVYVLRLQGETVQATQMVTLVR